MSEQIEDRLEIAERVYEKRDGVWWEIDVAGFRALEAMPAFVTQSMLSELTALRKEMGRAKEALCNIGPQDSHEDIRVWVGTALAALSEEEK